MNVNIRQAAYQALMTCDVDEKITAVQTLYGSDKYSLDNGLTVVPVPVPVPVPGRPSRPILVAGADVPRRKIGTSSGRLVQFHAFAHIEFNAINLALDAVYRFPDMPMAYYRDWLKVAAEESTHFQLLRRYLRERGSDYGDYPAHNQLWDMAVATDHDVLVRMALVPRVLEARGLDVTPKIIERLRSVGDQAAVEILQRIYDDEIGHVAIGNRWFHFLCEQRGIDPMQTFGSLLKDYTHGYLVGPFNTGARLQAGFHRDEIDMLSAMALDMAATR